MENLPHSAIYFGDARDYWWHDDFIALMARRVDVARCRSVLDVGCGYGHWARVWLPHLARGVELTSIDPEERSLAEAARRNAQFAAEKDLDVRLSYLSAKVEALPFPDGAFDLVTAQTVLIHVPDIGAAITEMHRVLAPGGLLLLAEPNNIASEVALNMDSPHRLEVFAYESTLQKGKAALGEGDNSAGEYLPRWLDPQRFESVQSWMCDRGIPWYPPYTAPQTQAEIAELREFAEKGWHGRPPDEARRYYLAGGGQDFDRLYDLCLADDRRRLAEIDAGTYALAGGSVFHLFAAIKAA